MRKKNNRFILIRINKAKPNREQTLRKLNYKIKNS